MAYDLTVRQWGEALKISRQRAYRIIKHCGIPLLDGKVDSAEATRIWREQKDTVQADRGLSPAALAANSSKSGAPQADADTPESEAEPTERDEQDTSRGEAQRLREWIQLKQDKLELEEKEKRLIDAEEVRESVAGMVIASRAKLLVIGDELCEKLASLSSAVACRELVDNRIAEALEALAA